MSVLNMPQKKVLYVGMRADYGNPARGISFEERNFHDPLIHYPDLAVTSFDYYAIGEDLGKQGMSNALLDKVFEIRPDLLFFVGFDDERDPSREVMARITHETDTATMLWICDDHWKFDKYSSTWAPCLDWIVSTDPDSMPKYSTIGMRDRAILSQWAVNHRLYHPIKTGQDIDISFVGQPHGERRNIIEYLERKGFRIRVFGHGWGERGKRLPFHEMIRIFSRSKINLNLNNSSNHASLQIKGRNFEVPGCHAFLLTHRAPHLDRYFEFESEIATFDSEEEMVEKIRYYLMHEDERRGIATRGYARSMKEHCWTHRFRAIFARIGLFKGSAKNPAALMAMGV